MVGMGSFSITGIILSLNILKLVFFFLNIRNILKFNIHFLQPTILSHTSARTPKISQKSDLWSLLKDLNSELKNKQYLIEV